MKNSNIKIQKHPRRKESNGFNWVYIIGTVVVVGGVMAFGLVSTLQFHVERGQAIGMLGMVFPMAFFYYVAIGPVVRNLQKKIERLTVAMDEVASGNLDCQIDTNKAGEYEDVYKQFNAMTMELKRTKEEMEAFTNEFAH
ncbi:MAG: HAMP domain-containing protein, partial [Lachnospiraceae bacterium]|nr:HAMP domain-containing protein [Lachnospiraceae bacterium]